MELNEILKDRNMNNLLYWEGAVYSKMKALSVLFHLPDNHIKLKTIMKERGELKKNFRQYIEIIRDKFEPPDRPVNPSHYKPKVVNKVEESKEEISGEETPIQRILRLKKEKQEQESNNEQQINKQELENNEEDFDEDEEEEI